jgi:hypothetical protein
MLLLLLLLLLLKMPLASPLAIPVKVAPRLLLLLVNAACMHTAPGSSSVNTAAAPA